MRKNENFIKEVIMGEELTGQASGSGSVNMERATTGKRVEIANHIGDVLYWYKRPRVTSPEDCATRLNEYFDYCYTTGSIPTWEEVALALGTSVNGLADWERKNKMGPAIAQLVAEARTVLSAVDAKLASTGAVYNQVYIFRAKNFYGLSDRQDVQVTSTNPLLTATDPAEIQKRYLDSLPEIEGGHDDGSMGEV